MGQLLIVQGGGDPQKVADLYSRAAVSFESLCRLKPSAEFREQSIAVAKFPRLHAPSAGIAWSPTRSHWLCGVGTYFYQDKAAPACMDALLRDLNLEGAVNNACLAGVDGIFGLACGDSAGKDLYIITDPLGSLHLYMAFVDTCVLVSTSSMVLAALMRPKWNPVACREFLGTGTIFEQRSLFEGIEKLEPASLYRFHDGRLQSRSLHTNLAQYMYDVSRTRGDVPQLAEALTGVIATIGKNFPNPVCDLTGGFDSRAVLGAMMRAGCRFQTVVNGASDLPDVLTSKRIAQEFALPHLHQPPRLTSSSALWERAKASLSLCDGEYEVLLYAGVSDVHSRLAERFDASINGSNGEICKGYWWELLFPFTGWRDHFDSRQVAAKRFAFEQIPDLVDFTFQDTLVDHFADVIRRANASLEDYPNTAKMDNVYLTLRMQRWQGRIVSASSRIWPCISPFMWRKPMQIALSAPPSVKVRNRMARALIEYFDPRLAAIPLAEGYPALPLRLNTAHLFWPLAVDLSHKVRKKIARKLTRGAPQPPDHPSMHSKVWQEEEVRELLNPDRMLTRDLFRLPALKQVLSGAKGNSPGHTRLLSRILTLELLASTIRYPPAGS
jgi:hypothetical protein